MTQQSFRAAVLMAALPFAAASAQQTRVFTFDRGDGGQSVRSILLSDRPMLGVTLNEESERADTLGLRVDDVTNDSPADKAGIKDGDRLQSVNGVSLRADRADAGERDYDGVLLRRLQREMAKLEEGDTVTLRVYSDGRARDVKVVTVSPEQMYGVSTTSSASRRAMNDRAVIGVSTSPMGNARDTLGVFVSSVNDSGPAAKAGLVEGDRIAAINGVSLRVAREDAGDAQVAQAKADRLRTELGKVTAGAAVELTVISAGRSRNVRVTTVKASDLPGAATTVWGYGTTPEALQEALARTRARMPMPTMAPLPPTPPTPPAPPAAPRVRTIYRGVRVL
jgi:serine protease Do